MIYVFFRTLYDCAATRELVDDFLTENLGSADPESIISGKIAHEAALMSDMFSYDVTTMLRNIFELANAWNFELFVEVLRKIIGPDYLCYLHMSREELAECYCNNEARAMVSYICLCTKGYRQNVDKW